MENMKKALIEGVRMNMSATLVAVAASVVAVSCEKVSPTDLTEDALPVKSIVCGHVRYCPSGLDTYTAESDLAVNVFYGQPDKDGNVEYALKTLQTDRDGYFETTLGCPPGESYKVKVECAGTGDSKTTDEKNKSVTVEAYFHAEISKDVPSGGRVYFKVDMAPTAYFSDSGLKQ